MLLYMAARAQLVDEQIAPALAAGRVVISDRFLLANVVYQGHAGGLDVASVWQVGEVATAGIKPDLVFLLDIDPRLARERIDRPLDRLESRDIQYRARLREGFLLEARRLPQQIMVMDAAKSADEVHASVCAAARRVLTLPNGTRGSLPPEDLPVTHDPTDRSDRSDPSQRATRPPPE